MPRAASAVTLLLLAALIVPEAASAHPLLSVGFSDGGATMVLRCGDTRLMEPECFADGFCEEGVCFEVQGLPTRYCLTPGDAICCDDVAASQCPIVEGRDVRCVFIESGPGVRVEGTVGLCIYDLPGENLCARRALTSPRFAARCVTQPGGEMPDHLAPYGDCDGDTLENVEDDEPCGPPDPTGDAGPGEPAMDAGPGSGSGAAPPLRFHGAGGCSCGVPGRGAGEAGWGWIFAVCAGIAGAWGATRTRRARAERRSR